MAVTVRAWVIGTIHVLVPLLPPLQPVKSSQRLSSKSYISGSLGSRDRRRVRIRIVIRVAKNTCPAHDPT